MEWQLLSAQPCNVLLEGPFTVTDGVLRLLQPHLRGPIAWHRSPALLDLPNVEPGALILTDVATLGRDEQRRLLTWLGEAGSHTRIISTSVRPLFETVATGSFDAALYYRLNVLLLRLTAQ